MKALLRTFLVIIFLINFSLPLSASQHSSVTKESPMPENGIPQKNKTSLEEETILKNRTLPVEKDCIFIIDNSITMAEGDPEYLIKEALTDYFANLNANMRIGLVLFTEKASMIFPLSSVEEEGFSEKISSSLQDIDYSGQFTNPAAALEEALYELRSNSRDSAQKVIVLISNGLINMGDQEKDYEVRKLLTDSLATDAKKNGIFIFSLAVSKNSDYLLFQTLAERTKASYYRLPQIQDIEKTLNKLSHEIDNLEVKTVLKTQEKESSSFIAIIIAIVVIMIIALGTVGIVFLVISKGSKKTPKKKKKTVAVAEYQAAEPLSSSDEKQMKNIPEAELRDLSQVTNEDSLEVKVPITSIGREYGNDIIIPKNTVSSRHATIEYRNGYFYLVDHRSSNGSFINGSKIDSEGKLKSGDLLAFDVFKFQFILPTLTALGQPQGQIQSQYSAEDNRMTILRPQQRPAGSDTKSKAKSKRSQQNPFSGETKKSV